MPFHSLSVETACHIFIEANSTSRARLPNPRSIPLVITAVCKWWRNAAIACQPLWTFYLVDSSRLLRNGPLYLTRAGNSTIHMQVPCRVSPPNIDVYEMLARHTVCGPSPWHRWLLIRL